MSSVHLEDFPQLENILDNKALVQMMDIVRDVCNVGLSIRNEENIRIRQPLADATIYSKYALELEPYKAIIADELNIKNINLDTNIDDVASLDLKIIFPVVGKRLGAKMKSIAALARSGDWNKTAEGIEIGGEILSADEYNLDLKAKNLSGAGSLSSNDALLVLNLNISEELEQEGTARDIVRSIQQARKDIDLNISDYVDCDISCDDKTSQAINIFRDYICKQTLCRDIKISEGEIDIKINRVA